MAPLFGKRKNIPEQDTSVASANPPSIVAQFPSPNSNGDPNTLPDVVIGSPTPSTDDDLELSKKLGVASTKLYGATNEFQSYNASKATKLANMSGDMLSATQTDVTTAQSYSSSLKTAFESDAMKNVRDGLNTLMESLPGLIKALDEVAQIHPFIGLAVGAFKVVIELDVKRRSNDKKISVLFLEMRDMMAALLQLRTIKDEESVGPDGVTIKARMQELVKKTADDIMDCANACDTYSKKKLLVKVLKGSVWDSTLQGFITLFEKRCDAFHFAMSIHVSVGVDNANEKLNTLDDKIDLMLEFFVKTVSAQEQELARLVQRKGGAKAVLQNDEALEELLALKLTSSTTLSSTKDTDRKGADHTARAADSDLDILKKELFDDPATAISKNFDAFERKFKMQQRELAEEMSRVIHHEGDRVIESVTSGPHDKIIDPDIHDIWKEMRWRGSVKARHFVLALRDYYREKMDEKKRKLEHLYIAEADEWALEYINVTRLQPIIEAFDDDASGFITVAEVNQFTTSRPKDWSLLHWLAYWAIGWQMTTITYAQKIHELFNKMFSLKPLLHPANRNDVDKYFDNVWQLVTELTMSCRKCAGTTDALRARFQSYVDSEEQRLREGLETVCYDVDAADTLKLITGPGRIEKCLFPLLYLLLSRDYEIMRVCRTTIINKDELWDAADTIQWVFRAIADRHTDLEALFKQQRLDPAQQFKVFACEMFDYWHDSSECWTMQRLRESEWPQYEYDDSVERQDIDISKLLNYPVDSEDVYNVQEDIETDADRQAEDPLKAILGKWNGFLANDRYPYGSMLSIYFHASSDGQHFEATSSTAGGTAYSITGDANVDSEGLVTYTFTQAYVARYSNRYWRGTINESGTTFSGIGGNNMEDLSFIFIFKRVPPEVMCFRPPPIEFERNRTRALWQYALNAVENQVRRRMFSWTYLKPRRDNRRKYIDCLIRQADTGLTADGLDELRKIVQSLTRADARWYNMMHDYQQRSTPVHITISCENCGETIHGGRVVCLECDGKTSVDFCDKPTCMSAEIHKDKRDDLESPHLTTHNVFKLRTNILDWREYGQNYRAARDALKKAQAAFEDSAEMEAAHAGTDGGDVELSSEQVVRTKESETLSAEQTTPDTAVASPSDEASESENAPNRTAKIVEKRLACVVCGERVARPCWYCFVCEDDTFICNTCDAKGGVSVGKHQASHGLVRCQEEVAVTVADEDKQSPTDLKLENMETRFAAMETKFGAVETKFGAVDDRLLRMEQLLEVIGALLAKGGTQLDGGIQHASQENEH